MITSLLIGICVTYMILNLLIYLFYLMYKPNRSCFEQINSQKICLVIAHPDDECMFFGPIIQTLLKNKSNSLYVLCMTTGDYNRLGKIRTKELKSSLLNLAGAECLKTVNIVDNPELPDHPTVAWNREVCGDIIRSFIEENQLDIVITFDPHGISAHPNHCFLYDTIKCLDFKAKPPVYILETVSLLRKYSLIFDLIFSMSFPSCLIAVSSPLEYINTFRSMLKHVSQLVWFRWLYIVTSRYMFINTLRKI